MSLGGLIAGAWYQDARSGEGQYTYANGDIYKGGWSENKKHGVGTYFFKNTAAQVSICDFCDFGFVCTQGKKHCCLTLQAHQSVVPAAGRDSLYRCACGELRGQFCNRNFWLLANALL